MAATDACPICGKPAGAATHPFCSKRCRDVDLHRWLAGLYSLHLQAGDRDPDTGDPAAPDADEPREG